MDDPFSRSSISKLRLVMAGAVASGLAFAFASVLRGVPADTRPGVDDIERILVTYGDGAQTTFAASLKNRPGVYGVFSLQYASGTPRLEAVRPVGPSIDYLIEKVVSTTAASARLEPRSEPERNWFSTAAAPMPRVFREVWLRRNAWPRTDTATGLRLQEPIHDWAVSPSGRFALVSRCDLSLDGVPGRFSSEGPPARGSCSVSVIRRGVAPKELVQELPSAPRIFELTERTVRLVIFGELPDRGRLEAASSPKRGVKVFGTTACDLSEMKCEAWRLRDVPSARSFSYGHRILIGGGGSWDLLDKRTLDPVAQLPKCERCGWGSEFAYLLQDGRIVRLALLGSMPNWESQLSSYAEKGREMVVTSLGNVRQTRFAGELGDGSVAILWRVLYANHSLDDPVFGWTLDAWNPRTGERRRLADDLATFPSAVDDASMIFLDRNGRLVVPAVAGVRVLAQLGYQLPVN